MVEILKSFTNERNNNDSNAKYSMFTIVSEFEFSFSKK